MRWLSNLGRNINREVKKFNSAGDLAKPFQAVGDELSRFDTAARREMSRWDDDVRSELSRFDDRHLQPLKDGLLSAFAPQGGGQQQGYTMPQAQNPWAPRGGYGQGPSPQQLLQSYFGGSSHLRPETQAYQSPFGNNPFGSLNALPPVGGQQASQMQQGPQFTNNKGPAMQQGPQNQAQILNHFFPNLPQIPRGY